MAESNFSSNVDIDRPEGVTQLLDLQDVDVDGHIPLFNVVQLLAELKLSCGCVGRKYLFEVPSRLFWCFGLSDVVEHVIMNARCKAMHHT